MTRHAITGLIAVSILTVFGGQLFAAAIPEEKPAASTNAAPEPKSISIQEMLIIGHPTMKMHSLAMITQGNTKGGVDESYLPGFKVCADDPNIPIRSITARLLGEHFVEGKEVPNPEAVALLTNLAGDETADVRFNAVYYGLSRIEHKSPEIIELLIDVAASDRNARLYDCIAQSLENHRKEAARILDEKLQADNAIAFFEIYEDLAAKKPEGTERFLDMPSSRPRLFIIDGGSDDGEAAGAELESELKSIGMENPEIYLSDTEKNHMLILKTFLTRDRIAVKKAFADHDRFKITQELWLTPEYEIWLDGMRSGAR